MRKYYIPAPLFMEVPILSKRNYPDYAIKEFLGRHEEKILNYIFENNLEVVTSNQLGYGDFKFIGIYTKPYPYGESKIIVNPDLLYSDGTVHEYEIIHPVTKQREVVKAPGMIFVTGWKYRGFISNKSVPYFLIALEMLYEVKIDLNKLISKTIPPTIFRKYRKELEEKARGEYYKVVANRLNKVIIVE